MPLLEYKSICNLEKLGGPDVQFSLWKTRLENSLNGIKPLYSPLLKELLKSTETRLIEYDFVKACNPLSKTHDEFRYWNGKEEVRDSNNNQITPKIYTKITWRKLNEDLWSLLTELTQSETLSKVKTANNLRYEAVDVGHREQDALRNKEAEIPDAFKETPENEALWKYN